MITSLKNRSVALTKTGSFRRNLAILVLSLLLPSAVSAQCLTATTSNGWQNAVMTSQTGTFTATFDATPSAAPTNSVIALSNGAQTAYANFACLARFNPTGDIDARNGGAYAAASTIPYSANVSYHFRLAVNIPAQTYSIYVTPAGGSELTVGLNYAFRISDTTLNWYGVFVDSGSGGVGSVSVCNFSTGGSVNYTITPSAGSGGSISPSSTVTVNQGGNQTFTVTPNAGFVVAGVTVDGTNVGAVTTYTFSNVQANHTINASFNPIPQFTITASAGANGSISPSGTITVNQGANQAFTIAANSGFVVSSVLVDGASQGAISSFTFSNVQGNHTISATFAAGSTCTNETGTTNAPLSSAQAGTFTATWDATPSISGINATMSLCSGSQTAYASYSCITRFFTSGDIDAYNGTAYTSASTIPYTGGTTYHFEMDVNVPAHTYSIYVTPQGGSKTLVGGNYAFRSSAGTPASLNTFNVDISGSGAVNICNLAVGGGTNFTITASAGSGGSISPSGTVTVNQGGNQTFTITSSSGFNVSSVMVDGTNVGAVTSYTFSNVQAAHTISAAFAPVPTFAITASAGSGGSISPSGSVAVPQGGNQSFTITPNAGFTVSSVTVDGTNIGAVTSYTFTNVQGSHTISAAFQSSNGGFIHPGVMVNKAELDLIKSRVAQGVQPQASAFSAAQSSSYGSLSYTPHPWQTVDCGASSNPDFGCTDEKNDSAAAYTQALLWYITGNTTYAQNAVKIMNAWSSTLTGGHTNSNAPLETAWTATNWARGGEIIRYTYTGWAAANVTTFENMLKNQYLPYIINGSCSNGNWELSMVDSLVNVGVFLDDKATFNTGLSLWRSRVPAYFYLTSDGSGPKLPGHCSLPSWYGQNTFVNGLCQETCRDLSHTQYGFAAAINAAMTARLQGVGLFEEQATRITDTMEFHTNYLNGASVPSWLCGGTLGLNSYQPTWIIAYNYYHNVLGYNLPQTAKANASSATTGATHHMIWEKLTHGDIGAVGLPPITTP
jgi:hypothetical protein